MQYLSIKIGIKSFGLATILGSSLFFSACSSQIAQTEMDTKAAEYNAELGVKYLQNGRLQLANQKLEKALEQNPDSANAHHYYAILQQRLKQNSKAEQHFKRALALNNKNPEIRNNYGSFLCSIGRHQAAVQQFLIAIKDPLYSTPEYAYTNAGICSYKAKKPADAERYFRLALKKRHNFGSALLQMSKLYYDKREYPRAQAFLLRYEKVGQSTPEALQLCTQINNKMGNPAKARRCTTALLRLFPGSEEATRISSAH